MTITQPHHTSTANLPTLISAQSPIRNFSRQPLEAITLTAEALPDVPLQRYCFFSYCGVKLSANEIIAIFLDRAEIFNKSFLLIEI